MIYYAKYCSGKEDGLVQKHRYSLNILFAIVGLILLVAIAGLVISNAYIASRTIRRQTYEIMSGAAAMQAQRIRDDLDTAASHLAGFSYDNGDIITLETNSRDSSGWFSSLYRLRNNFNNAVSAQVMECYFLYMPDTDVFFSGNAALSSAQQSALRTLIGDMAGRERRWQSVPCEDVIYLAYILRVHNSYLGAWVSVDSILAGSSGETEHGMRFDIADRDGMLLSSEGLSRRMDDYSSALKDGYQMVTLEGESYLLVAHSAADNDFSLVALVPNASLGGAVTDYLMIVIPIVIAAFGFLVLIIHGLWRVIIQPVKGLTQAIRRLRGGDAEARVSAPTACVELDEMSIAFNEMVQEIGDLKIGVYEEQLLRQNIQIEYLKMQVTPHFLVNCLNTVYQLTEAGQPQLTLKMVKGLSRHLRYMLDAGMMVPLSQELEMVENYLELTSVRYPGCLELTTDYAPEAMDATAIPLLVLNFVENTVKYEAVLGKHLEIHVASRVEHLREHDRLCITVWDTGGGFSDEILEKLTDLPGYIRETQNRHIGISNVFQRSQLILGECGFRFSNRPGAGAQIDMDLPFAPYHGKGEVL